MFFFARCIINFKVSILKISLYQMLSIDEVSFDFENMFVVIKCAYLIVDCESFSTRNETLIVYEKRSLIHVS